MCSTPVRDPITSLHEHIRGALKWFVDGSMRTLLVVLLGPPCARGERRRVTAAGKASVWSQARSQLQTV